MPTMSPTAGKAEPKKTKKKKLPFLMRWAKKRKLANESKKRQKLYDEAGK